MKIGSIVLRVKKIKRVLDFYQKYFGLQLNNKKHRYDNNNPAYGLSFEHLTSSDTTMSPLLILHHDPNARNASPSSAGLYHFAILVPDRKSLASTYLALKLSGVHFDGFADHLVSESLYLRDPEGNGIEIYHDRPSRKWPRDSAGNIMMGTLPLDLQSLIEEMNHDRSGSPMAFPTGAKIGHIHLRVTNLDRSIMFYHEILGQDITVNWKQMGAAFLSTGGYHHHIGMNTWHSLNGEGHIQGMSGLENFTITIPDKSFSTLWDTINRQSANYEPQRRIQETDKNQLMVSDPDGIQIVCNSE
ncbi:MAG: VOC family protein [Nitrososphaeraceae archaeon]